MNATFGLILIPIHFLSLYLSLKFSRLEFLIGTYCLVFLLGVPSLGISSDYYFYPTYFFFLPIGIFYLFKGDIFLKKEYKFIKSNLDKFILLIVFTILFSPILGGYFDITVYINAFLRLFFYYSFSFSTFLYLCRSKKYKLINYALLYPFISILTYFLQIIGFRHPLGDESYIRSEFLIFKDFNAPALFSSNHNAGVTFIILNFILYISLLNFKPRIRNIILKKIFHFIKNNYSYLIIILSGIMSRSFLLFLLLSFSFTVIQKIVKSYASKRSYILDFIFPILIAWIVVILFIYIFIDPSNLLKISLWIESFKLYFSQTLDTIIFGMSSNFTCDLQNIYNYNSISLNLLNLEDWDINLSQFNCFPIHNIYIEFLISYGLLSFVLLMSLFYENFDHNSLFKNNSEYANLANFMNAIIFNYLFHNGIWGPWIYAFLMLIILKGVYNTKNTDIKS